jgi:hypothetical protein
LGPILVVIVTISWLWWAAAAVDAELDRLQRVSVRVGEARRRARESSRHPR